jgi:hypothetical protein
VFDSKLSLCRVTDGTGVLTAWLLWGVVSYVYSELMLTQVRSRDPGIISTAATI